MISFALKQNFAQTIWCDIHSDQICPLKFIKGNPSGKEQAHHWSRSHYRRAAPPGRHIAAARWAAHGPGTTPVCGCSPCRTAPTSPIRGILWMLEGKDFVINSTKWAPHPIPPHCANAKNFRTENLIQHQSKTANWSKVSKTIIFWCISLNI